MQKLMGRPSAPVEEQVQSEQLHDQIHEERVDSAAGMVGGEGVMPNGEVANITGDQEAPPPPEEPPVV